MHVLHSPLAYNMLRTTSRSSLRTHLADYCLPYICQAEAGRLLCWHCAHARTTLICWPLLSHGPLGHEACKLSWLTSGSNHRLLWMLPWGAIPLWPEGQGIGAKVSKPMQNLSLGKGLQTYPNVAKALDPRPKSILEEAHHLGTHSLEK